MRTKTITNEFPKAYLRIVFLIAVATVLLAARAVYAAEQSIPETPIAGETFILPEGDTIVSVQTPLELPNGTFTIGGGGIGFAANLSTVHGNKAAGPSVLNIVSATKAGGDTGTGIQLNISNFSNQHPTGSTVTVNIGASSNTGTNSVVIDTFEQANAGAPTFFNVGKQSSLEIRAAAGGLGAGSAGTPGVPVSIALTEGNLTLGSSAATLVSGSISGATGFANVVSSGLTIKGMTGKTATLSVNAGTLNILNSFADGDYGNLVVGGGAGNSQLEIIGDGTLNVNNLTLKAGAQFAAPTNSGTLNVYGDLAVMADFQDARDVATIVRGETGIDSGYTYTVNGTKNNYQGTMTVEGILRNDANGDDTILMGTYKGTTAVSQGTMEISGGSVQSRGANFVIDNALITITKGSGSATLHSLHAGTGTILDLRTSDVVVDLTDPGDTATIQADGNILMETYRQLSGTVQVTNGGGQMKVSDTAIIGGGTGGQLVMLDVSGNAVVFESGLTLDSYGGLSATRANGTVTLGTSAKAQDLVLNGDNLLFAGAGNTLSIKSAYTGKDSVRFQVNGAGNAAFGNIDLSQFTGIINQGGELTVASAGINPTGLRLRSLAVEGRLYLGTDEYPTAPGVSGGAVAGATITTTGDFRVATGGWAIADHAAALISHAGTADGLFVVSDGGHLVADTAVIRAQGFDSVNMNGTFTAGILGGLADTVGTPRFIADTDIKIGSTGIVTLTNDFAKEAVADDDYRNASWLMQATNGGVITSDAELETKSIMGQYGYSISDNRQVLYVSSIGGRVVLDGTEDDRRQALENLQDIWGKNQIKPDLGDLIYDIVKKDVVSDGSVSGDKNVDIFDAIANPAGQVVGRDTLEYMNGAHLYGPTDVSMEVSRSFMSDMQARAKAIHCQYSALRDYAENSSACNGPVQDASHLNRLWGGATGIRHEADSKDGFSGYNYEGYGLVGGYDRVVAENLAVGAAFAYNKGDYEDDGTQGSDSKIETMSVGMYGTFSHCSGGFVSLSGAYTYAANKLHEKRQDPSISDIAWSRSDYRTETLNAQAIFGIDLRLNDCWTITPSVGINYIQAKNSDHDAYLDDVAIQRVRGVKNRQVLVPAELMIQYTRQLAGGGGLRVFAKGGYTYNLRESGMTGTIDYHGLDPARSIGVHGRDNARSAYTAGAGLAYNCSRYEVGARYDFLGREDATAHRLLGTVGVYF